MSSLRYLMHTVCVVGLFVCATTALAGQSKDNNTSGGLSVSVDLRHRVEIPQILYFRIGSGTFGSVDKVVFDVGAAGTGNNQTYSGAPVPGSGTPIAATSNGSLYVQIMANVGSLTLNYDLSDPLGLSDGGGTYIPFDEISVVSADPGGLPAPALSNAGAGGGISVPISGNSHGGRVVRRDTTWTYTYLNQQSPAAGTYDGRVTYTLSAP